MKRFATTDEWVSAVNRLAYGLDELTSALHPTAWANDPDIKRLSAEYRATAAAQVDDQDEWKREQREGGA